ncbi:MAG: hypothetical protein AVDCRST_MAG07-84 [uncultured Frankineae bacterium]|uniref:Uncharacterized protein n=1 Tax=uncultured Frankineae bacterium TaxID=437475 RepID=A0A6J4KH80_9ACTN|nr:MAG: hypothetical protein AVDCRST_MAG07-84 [uncultured Frankineae bacterium]
MSGRAAADGHPRLAGADAAGLGGRRRSCPRLTRTRPDLDPA